MMARSLLGNRRAERLAGSLSRAASRRTRRALATRPPRPQHHGSRRGARRRGSPPRPQPRSLHAPPARERRSRPAPSSLLQPVEHASSTRGVPGRRRRSRRQGAHRRARPANGPVSQPRGEPPMRVQTRAPSESSTPTTVVSILSSYVRAARHAARGPSYLLVAIRARSAARLGLPGYPADVPSALRGPGATAQCSPSCPTRRYAGTERTASVDTV